MIMNEPNFSSHYSTPSGSAGRLILRPFVKADSAAFHHQINDWEICRRLPEAPFPYPSALADDWVASAIEDHSERTAFEFAVIERATSALIGSAGLRPARRGSTASLGYWIGRAFWGQGYAREAVAALIDWGFTELPISTVTANVAADNVASIAVLRRLGFVETGMGHAKFIGRPGERLVVQQFSLSRETHDRESRKVVAPAAIHEPEGNMLLVAACALVDRDGRILLARRPAGKKLAGLWEFPGGKVMPGELPESALVRELDEELGICVTKSDLAPFVFASHSYSDFHLLMPLFFCRRWSGTPVGREGQALAWVAPERLDEYPMPPADRPLIPMLRDFL